MATTQLTSMAYRYSSLTRLINLDVHKPSLSHIFIYSHIYIYIYTLTHTLYLSQIEERKADKERKMRNRKKEKETEEESKEKKEENTPLKFAGVFGNEICTRECYNSCIINIYWLCKI